MTMMALKQEELGGLVLPTPEGMVRLEEWQIYYVEIQKGILHYHTTKGDYALRGTLQSVEDLLDPRRFVRCNYWYLVNLRHVTDVVGDTVCVADRVLQISRRKRTPFMQALTSYLESEG